MTFRLIKPKLFFSLKMICCPYSIKIVQIRNYVLSKVSTQSKSWFEICVPGMIVDPNATARTRQVQLRNAAILARVQAANKEGGQNIVTFSQRGLITNRCTVQQASNPHRTHAAVWCQDQGQAEAEVEAPAEEPPVPANEHAARPEAPEIGGHRNPIVAKEDEWEGFEDDEDDEDNEGDKEMEYE